MVRTPQPENSSGPIRCLTTDFALDFVHDPAPEEMAVVRREGVDLRAVRSEGEGEVAPVGDPEVAVEAALELGRLLLELVGDHRVLPDLAREARAAHLGVVGVALQLAGRAREAGQPAVPVRDRVPGVLPALVLEAGLLVPPLVRDVAVALEVRVLVDPLQRGEGLVLEVANELSVAGPALVLVQQDDEQRRCVGRAVVRGVRPLLEGGQLPVAHLVQDPAGILVAEIVDARALARAELAKRGRGQLGRERKRLQAGEDAVAAEHGHEPREAGGGKAPAPRAQRREAQRGEVDEAAHVGVLERRPVAFETRRVAEPAVEPGGEVPLRALWRGAAAAEQRDRNLHLRGPLALRRDPGAEGQSVGVELRAAAGADRGRLPVRLPPVPEHQAPALDLARVLPLLLQRVLDLEEVGEVASRLEPKRQVERLLIVVEDGDLLVEAVGDGARANDRLLRVLVDGARLPG